MSKEETVTGQTQLTGIKKRIIPFDEDEPAIEPLFINFAHGATLGDDFYLDIGVITLESVDPTATPVGKIGDFAVLSRLVMSKRTMLLVREQIDKLMESRKADGGS